MRQKTGPQTSAAEKTIKDIRRATRKQHSSEEKIRIVLEGLRGEDSIAAICRREGIAESLYYSWSKEFLEAGKKRLAGDTARSATSDEVKALRRESRDLKEALADLTLENRVLKKTSMKVEDVTDTLDLALAASGCDRVKVEHRPRLLSDNGPCYVAADLGEWLEKCKIEQVHGAPGHPQTQGKIERWHQTLKNRILLENYFFQEDLEAQIAAFVEHYNHCRYHESLDNLTPADVYFGHGQTILLERERIKRETIKQRRLNHQTKAA
ncbi:MAG: transposase [Alphaproteobacteria bacterium]|nr:MAG: transposase [Alphaproteobacteria bacterium]